MMTIDICFYEINERSNDVFLNRLEESLLLNTNLLSYQYTMTESYRSLLHQEPIHHAEPVINKKKRKRKTTQWH
jgi:hypothetical protein